MSEQIKKTLRSLPPARWLRRKQRARKADVYLLSFPKVGRTWLRTLIGALLAEHYGHPELAASALSKRARRVRGVPHILVKHDGQPHRSTPAEIEDDKSEFADTRVILMVRDLRDTTVSNYFQATRREGTFQGDITAWLAEPRGSVDSMLRYYHVWAQQRHLPRGFLLVRYEDLKRDTAHELRRIAEFIGMQDVKPATIAAAVEYGSFGKMREREAAKPADGTPFAAGKEGDPESFKTRRGKVGGYVDYLTPEQVAWLERRIHDELDPFYGYRD